MQCGRRSSGAPMGQSGRMTRAMMMVEVVAGSWSRGEGNLKVSVRPRLRKLVRSRARSGSGV